MQVESAIAEQVLSLLHAWGWEAGLEKLHSRIEESTDQNERASLRYLLAWLAGERGAHAIAVKHFKMLEETSDLKAWALLGQVFIDLREGSYDSAHEQLNVALAERNQNDLIFLATATHLRGSIFYHQSDDDRALKCLHEALSIFGKDHFGSGRVIDSLGMVYASKDNFHAAREFFNRAIDSKERFKDSAGVAVSHGQLGRLYLDWGNARKAREHFNVNLRISRQIGDKRGEAQTLNFQGNAAAATGEWQEAADWLTRSIQLSHEGGWKVLEGYARKDRALLHLKQGELEEAKSQISIANDLFRAVSFIEGIAHVNRVVGIINRIGKEFDQAERNLNESLRYFDTYCEHAEAARTQLEIARTLRLQGSSLTTSAMQDALSRAEDCRRDLLVREIENELREFNEIAYYHHIHKRVRGRNASVETSSLLTGLRETATVMFLDIEGSTEYARSRDPEIIMMTLNQMMAEFATVLKKHEVAVTAYLGDGFMALIRSTDHACRAVRSAFDLGDALMEFNQPRDTLGLRPLKVRIGIATGDVFIGNVGTYDKMDFTAIGTTSNLAARLQSEAEPGIPCISDETYQKSRDDFVFSDASPRLLDLKGLGKQRAWDVVGKKES
jgi:class 3 adenylate cyclase